LQEFYLEFGRKNQELIDRLTPARVPNNDAIKSAALAAEVKCLTMDGGRAGDLEPH